MNNCIFCRIASQQSPAEVVYEDEKSIAFLDITPHTPGHTLVIPKEHYENFLALPDDLLVHLSQVIKKIAPAIVRGGGASGFNIGVNNGEAAGQIVGHMHFHIIPRNFADGLIMWEGKSYQQDDLKKYAERIRLELSGLKK